MNEPGKLVRLKCYKAARSINRALPFLEAQLRDSDSMEIVGRNRPFLAKLIIEYCNSDLKLQEDVGVSNEELERIADGPIPKQLVENFIAHLKSVRICTAACLCR